VRPNWSRSENAGAFCPTANPIVGIESEVAAGPCWDRAVVLKPTISNRAAMPGSPRHQSIRSLIPPPVFDYLSTTWCPHRRIVTHQQIAPGKRASRHLEDQYHNQSHNAYVRRRRHELFDSSTTFGLVEPMRPPVGWKRLVCYLLAEITALFLDKSTSTTAES